MPQAIVVQPLTLVVEDYAIILPSGSPLRKAINRGVLHNVYSAGWKPTVQRYIVADEYAWGVSERLARCRCERPGERMCRVISGRTISLLPASDRPFGPKASGVMRRCHNQVDGHDALDRGAPSPATRGRRRQKRAW